MFLRAFLSGLLLSLLAASSAQANYWDSVAAEMRARKRAWTPVQRKFRQTLDAMGHNDIELARDPAEVIEISRRRHPDIDSVVRIMGFTGAGYRKADHPRLIRDLHALIQKYPRALFVLNAMASDELLLAFDGLRQTLEEEGGEKVRAALLVPDRFAEMEKKSIQEKGRSEIPPEIDSIFLYPAEHEDLGKLEEGGEILIAAANRGLSARLVLLEGSELPYLTAVGLIPAAEWLVTAKNAALIHVDLLCGYEPQIPEVTNGFRAATYSASFFKTHNVSSNRVQIRVEGLLPEDGLPDAPRLKISGSIPIEKLPLSFNPFTAAALKLEKAYLDRVPIQEPLQKMFWALSHSERRALTMYEQMWPRLLPRFAPKRGETTSASIVTTEQLLARVRNSIIRASEVREKLRIDLRQRLKAERSKPR